MPSPTLQPLVIRYGLRLDASDEFIQGYVDGMRLDQRGQGVACGRGWIPRSKKCSRDKASQTSKEAKARTVEKAKARGKLKGEVKAAKGQKARVKEVDANESKQSEMSPKGFIDLQRRYMAATSEDEKSKLMQQIQTTRSSEGFLDGLSSKNINLPELSGSEKQVKWANEIRGQWVSQFDEYMNKYKAQREKLKGKGRNTDNLNEDVSKNAVTFISGISSIQSASTFINNRNTVIYGTGDSVYTNDLYKPFSLIQQAGRQPNIFMDAYKP